MVTVSSLGGHLEPNGARHDTLGIIELPQRIVGTGRVGSAATHLFMGVSRPDCFCTPKMRFQTHPHSRCRARPQACGSRWASSKTHAMKSANFGRTGLPLGRTR